ncbi:hypothetical protein M3Y98_00567500 [Aphelenchoides besseyi]|nr:hypothetical protein M3Y98_00567500 [Aphelenchoides besseyi]KAI6193784.1 hypothetical protein M3Y96_01055500 [Aphelenchoides besseyi]
MTIEYVDNYENDVQVMTDDQESSNKRSTNFDSITESILSTINGTLSEGKETRTTTYLPNIQEHGYIPYSTAIPVLIVMAIIIVVMLCICCLVILIIRYNVKKEGKRKIHAKQDAIEKLKARTAVHMPVANNSPYVMTAEQKTKETQQQYSSGKQPVETQARDLAAVLSYLATHPVDDEDIEFRPSNRKILLVPTPQNVEH